MNQYIEWHVNKWLSLQIASMASGHHFSNNQAPNRAVDLLQWCSKSMLATRNERLAKGPYSLIAKLLRVFFTN